MIKVSKIGLAAVLAAIVGGVAIYLTTLLKYIQIIADASTTEQVIVWMISGWVFHKVSIAWAKLAVKVVLERASYEHK